MICFQPKTRCHGDFNELAECGGIPPNLTKWEIVRCVAEIRHYWVAGMRYYITVNLLERYPNDLLVQHIDLLQAEAGEVRDDWLQGRLGKVLLSAMGIVVGEATVVLSAFTISLTPLTLVTTGLAWGAIISSAEWQLEWLEDKKSSHENESHCLLKIWIIHLYGITKK